MLILPIQSKGHLNDLLVIVFDQGDIERMRKGDPAQIKMLDIKRVGKDLMNPTVIVCYEQDQTKLTQLINKGDIVAVLEYLQRGFEFRPDLGDHDRGPEGLEKSN